MHLSRIVTFIYFWFYGQFPGNLRSSPLGNNKTRREGPTECRPCFSPECPAIPCPWNQGLLKISMGHSVVPTFRTLSKGECIEREGLRRGSPSHWAFVNFALLNLTPTTLSSSCSSFRCQHHKSSISSNHRCQSGQA